MLAAVEGTCLLEAVPDDARTTMIAGRRKCVNGTFKTVERVRLATHRYLKRLVIVVTAIIAFRHLGTPFADFW